VAHRAVSLGAHEFNGVLEFHGARTESLSTHGEQHEQRGEPAIQRGDARLPCLGPAANASGESEEIVNTESRTVKLWLVAETKLARKFRTDGPEADSETVWIPKSVIHHVSNQGGIPPACAVEVEEWWLEENDL
jgi:hypothetical protein